MFFEISKLTVCSIQFTQFLQKQPEDLSFGRGHRRRVQPRFFDRLKF